MNQDQCKAQLLEIREAPEAFSVIFSGKKSLKVNGLYKPESREIVIHNKNFAGDNELMYTAIHEYAHHLHFTGAAVPVSIRSHTTRFWATFHELLYEAERKGLYANPFDSIPEFGELTKRIKGKLLTQDGELMKELGSLLVDAEKLCEKHHTSFGDYLDRVLALPRSSAAQVMRVSGLDVDSRIGFDNMKTVARIRDPAERKQAETALREGQSPDMVKLRFVARPEPTDLLEVLRKEKDRTVEQIGRLQRKLEELDRRIERAAEKGGAAKGDAAEPGPAVDGEPPRGLTRKRSNRRG
jgi:hypothetical protein